MRPANFVAVVRRRRATIILAVTAALVAAATAFGATAALPPYKLVLNYQAYVGGKGKAKPNLAPVKIGFINGQGGPVQFNFPQATSVIRAGVKMVNAELGGVNGHPVQLSECFWAQAEEEGIRCGQQMVNDKVKTIIFGFVTVPNQSIYATVRGTIPVTGGHHLQPGRHDGEERVLPERQPDDRDRCLRHVHEEALPEGQDHDRRLSGLARAPSRLRPRSGQASGRSE